MSRFYNAPTPNLQDDFMFKPPWELINQAMAVNEQGIENTLASTAIFDNLEIDYIDDPVVKAQVEKIKEKYTGTATEISKKMQAELSNSPQAWKSYMPKVATLGKELQKDFISGDINRISADKQRQTAWIEANKDKDPMLFNASYNLYMQRWQQDPDRKNPWQGEDLSSFDINSKEIMDGLKQHEAKIRTDVANGYISETKFRDRDAIIRDYMTTVFTDPQAQLYIQQAQQAGLPGFVDAKGNPIPFEVPINMETGQKISTDEFNYEVSKFNSLSDEEKALQGREEFKYKIVPNKDFAWTANFENIGDRLGGIISQTVKADATYNQRENRQFQIGKMRLQHEMNKELLNIKENIKAEADKIQEEKKRLKEIDKLQDQLITTGSPSKKAEIQKKIDRLTNTNIDEIKEVHTTMSFKNSQQILRNPGDKTSREYQLARNIDNTILNSALEKLGLGSITKISLTDNLDTAMNFDFKGDKSHKRIIETYLYFNDRFEGGFATDKDRQNAIKDYLVAEHGLNLDDLEKDSQKQVLSLGRGQSATTVKVPTNFFQGILSTLDKITDAKKESYVNYVQTRQPDAIFAIEDNLRVPLQNYILDNLDKFTVKSTSPTAKVPKLEELIREGEINHVTNESAWGESPIVKYKDEDYYVIQNQGERAASATYKKLFDIKGGYKNSEHYDLMKQSLENRFLSSTTNSFTELNKLVNMGIVYKDDNNFKEDEKGNFILDENDNKIPLSYSSISIPLIDGHSATIRYYLNPNGIKRYSWVSNKDGSSLDEYENIPTLVQAINRHVDALIEESRNKPINTTSYN